MDKLKIVLEDESIEKITYDLKNIYICFPKITLKGDIFDISLLNIWLMPAINMKQRNLWVLMYFQNESKTLNKWQVGTNKIIL